jgi:hypothetical protein
MAPPSFTDWLWWLLKIPPPQSTMANIWEHSMKEGKTTENNCRSKFPNNWSNSIK